MNLLPNADIPPLLMTYGLTEWRPVTGIYVIDDGSVVYVSENVGSLRSASSTGENRYWETTLTTPLSLTRADWNKWTLEATTVKPYYAVLPSRYFTTKLYVHTSLMSQFMSNQNMLIGGIAAAILVMAIVFGVYYKHNKQNRQ